MSHGSFVISYTAILLPPVLLALAGVTLAWKQRSFASYAVAIGFTIALICTLAALVIVVECPQHHTEYRTVSCTTDGWLLVPHYVGLGGAILGALGLVWYAVALKRERK